ncbi:MAG TPA: ELWxxDGT repeat protein, partial [Thermoanaerobaculia bacterium]|nr:ELWxxDGT repeat protein [Thermoanaerobaculia bacterium]
GAADPNHGYELWSSDGTKSGTRRLTDACPGSCPGWSPSEAAGPAVVAGGRVFFWAGGDLWVSDGSPDGTHRLHHDETGFPVPSGAPSRVFAVGERFVFPARDLVYGNEVFVTNDALESSEVVADLLTAAAGSQPTGFKSLGSRAIFAAYSGSGGGSSLWTTDGTAAGTAEVPDLRVPICDSSGQLCHEPVPLGNYLFFMERDDLFEYQLRRTDGTVAGSLRLTDVEGLTSDPGVAWAGKLYFTRDAGELGIELWSSDGTAAGTRALFILPGLRSAASFTPTGSELYFTASTGSSAEVWRTDGTLAGTRQVTAFAGTSHQIGLSPSFVRAGSAVWFLAKGPGAGELWSTDGTTAGTRLVANPNGTSDLVSYNGVLYFLAQASPAERALWRVNAAGDGITQLDRFPVGGGFFEPGARGLTVFQDHLYLVANGVAGLELWRSDGTVAGAHLVRDINPGPDGSGIGALTATSFGLFFSASDGIHGLELWRSDGTADGTRLVQDLLPGPVGSSPAVGVVAGTHLLIAATEEGVGREAWSLDLAAPRTCVASDTALCLDGNRFHVTATWKDFAGNRGVGHAKPLTADTGYFWFFGEENVEAVIKVLDGHGVNGHDWVFYGALSSVEYTLTVTDTQTGAVRRYFNPTGRLASVGDTQGFGPLGGYARTPPRAAAPAPEARRIASGDTSPCAASDTRLCLNGGRFAVEATWKDFAGHTGVGHAGGLTNDTGYLWFFSASNVEVVIKVLDGTPLNGKFWLFYGALSSVEYTLTVRDTVTGAVRVYRNVSGNMASVADTSAF